MRFLNGHWGHLVLLVLIPLWVSCGGSQELVDKSEELDEQIEELKAELAKVDKQLKSKEVENSDDLELVEADLREAKDEATRIAGQLAGLRDEKQSLENRFNKFRQDYPTN